MSRFSDIALPTSDAAHSREATAFLTTVHLWMFAGLSLTALTAWVVSTNQTILQAIYGRPYLYIGLMLAELGLVFVISGAIRSLSGTTATALFMLYSVVNGITLPIILMAYSGQSIMMAFLSAACLFGTMSLYGYMTKRDLTSWGNLLFIGLIAIIISIVINMLLRSPMLDYLISIVGIVIFLGLTAYDTQKILRLGSQTSNLPGDWVRKGAIVGALALYLDFINLFLYLLRFFNRRD